MSGSITSATASPVAHHGHHNAGKSGKAAGQDPLAALGSTPTSASLTAGAPGSPAASFASALQSILLDAQGQPADTASGGQGSPAAGPVRNVADRLQELLGGGEAVKPASGTANPAGLQQVLDRLQQTLAQTLQSYGKAAATQSSAVTA